MKIGLFMMPIHDLNRNMHTALEEDKEAVLLADQLAFEEVWIGEHFSAITEPIPFWADFGTLLYTAHDWDDPEKWKTSMALMAHEVLPKFS